MSDVSVAHPSLGTGDREFLSGSPEVPSPPVTSDILEVIHGVPDEPQPISYLSARIRSTFVALIPSVLICGILKYSTNTFST